MKTLTITVQCEDTSGAELVRSQVLAGLDRFLDEFDEMPNEVAFPVTGEVADKAEGEVAEPEVEAEATPEVAEEPAVNE